MEISFQIKNTGKNTVEIVVEDGSYTGNFTQSGFPNLGIAWTKTEAIAWAEEAIEHIRNESGGWVRGVRNHFFAPVFTEEEITQNLTAFIGGADLGEFAELRKLAIAADS